MKKTTLSQFISFLLMVVFVMSTTMIYSQKDSTLAKSELATTKAKYDSVVKLKTEADKKVAELKKENTTSNSLPKISENQIVIICVLFFIVIIVLVILFFLNVYKHNQYLGFQSIKYVGLVIMFPGICIIALAGGDLISNSTLAALFGTIAGYVLSKEDPAGENDTNALKKTIQELKSSEEKLKAEVERLKKG